MALLDSKVEKTGVFSAGRALLTDKTLRTDRWWLQPLITFTVLILFVIYATFRAFENKNYFAEPLISPFYSHVYQLFASKVLLTLARQLVPSHCLVY